MYYNTYYNGYVMIYNATILLKPPFPSRLKREALRSFHWGEVWDRDINPLPNKLCMRLIYMSNVA